MAKCGRKKKFEAPYTLQIGIEKAWYTKLLKLARLRSAQEDKTLSVADLVRQKVAELM